MERRRDDLLLLPPPIPPPPPPCPKPQFYLRNDPVGLEGVVEKAGGRGGAGGWRRPPTRREALAWVIMLLQFVALATRWRLCDWCGGYPEGNASAMDGRSAGYFEGVALTPAAPSDWQRRSPGRDWRAPEDAEAALAPPRRPGDDIPTRSVGQYDPDPMEGKTTADVPRQMTTPEYYESPIAHPKSAGLVSRTWRSNGSPLIHGDLKMGTCWCSADEWCMCTPSMAVDVVLLSGEEYVWLVRRADSGKLALMVSWIGSCVPLSRMIWWH